MKSMHKEFDALTMKRAGALRIYRRLKNKTFGEKVAYWSQRSEIFHREQETIKPAGRQSDSASKL